MVQLVFAASVTPDRLTLVPPENVKDVAPAAGAHVAPPHVPAVLSVTLAVGGLATWSPAGSASVKPAVVKAKALVLVSVKVSVEEKALPNAMGLGEKALESAGCTGVRQCTPVNTTSSSKMKY